MCGLNEMYDVKNENNNAKIGFIGAGKICRTLAHNLNSAGFNIHGVHSLKESSSQNICKLISDECKAYKTPQDLVDNCDLIFITTPDDSIQTVTESIKWRGDMGVVHCSGAGTSFWLDKARSDGASVASYHPLQTFSDNNSEIPLKNVYFAIEGDLSLTEYLKNVTDKLGGFSISIATEHKLLYHVSAFMACGLVATVIGKAVDIWKSIGYSEKQALDVLTPLIERTIHNISQNGVTNSLTGPISRGDIGTIKGHIDSLKKYNPSLLSTYCQLSLENISIELERKTDETLQEIELLLKSTIAALSEGSVV